VLVSSGIRSCEGRGPRPEDFEADAIDVVRSVLSVSRKHHPDGKTFLIRDYTKNGQRGGSRWTAAACGWSGTTSRSTASGRATSSSPPNCCARRAG
jgi:hypothetical protein